MKPRQLHRQVRIEHGDVSADVDEGIAALLLALWRLGFRTTGSCEAWPVLSDATGRDTAQITFESEEDWTEFGNRVAYVSSVLATTQPDEEVKR